MTQPAAAPATPATPAAAPPAPAAPAKTKSDPDKASRAQAEITTDAPVKKVRVTAHERAIKLKASIEKEEGPSGSQSADEGKTPAQDRAPPAPSSADSGTEAEPAKAREPAKDEAAEAAAKRRAERQKRLADAAEREQKADAERRQKESRKTSDGEVEKLRKRLADLEPLEQVFTSEEALLEAAEKKGMSTEKLVAWMRTRLTDPQAIAARQSQTVEQKFEAALAAERKKREELEERLERQATEAKEYEQATHRARSFESMVQTKAETHPLTATLLKRRGGEALVQFANSQIVPYLPENYELEVLHDNVEQLLDWIYGDGDQPAIQQTATSQPPKRNGAEKPVTTLSNSLGSQRESVTEAVPLHKMSLEDRARRLKESLGNE